MTSKIWVNKEIFLIKAGIWILCWFVPWGLVINIQQNLYLMFFVDLFKVGFALGMFILPGAFLFLILRERESNSINAVEIISVGFALSVAILSIIGLVGRILGLPFWFVKLFFALTGFFSLLSLDRSVVSVVAIRTYCVRLLHNILTTPSLIIAVILTTAVAFDGYQLFIDDWTYAAYSMNWQYSNHLGFGNIVHQVNVLEQSRFWLALYPMFHALISDLSGVPVFLIYSGYLELFLVPFAVLTAFWFAQVLGLSRKNSGLSVLIQIIFYIMMVGESWPVGFWFFRNMAEDKVAAVFLLAPVFFALVLRIFDYPSRRMWALLFLCGLGLMLTHPVILFLACSIVLGITAFSASSGKINLVRATQLVIMLVFLLMPFSIIRFYGPQSGDISVDAASVDATYQVERYVDVVNDVFYGMNLDVLKLVDISPESSNYVIFQFVRLLPIFISIIAGVLALINTKKGILYWYVIVCLALVALAATPYTGWILGYFISGRMLSRVSWFSPLGLSGVMVITSVAGLFYKNSGYRILYSEPSIDEGSEAPNIARGLLIGLTMIIIMMTTLIPFRAPFYFEILEHNKQLTQVGEYIDVHSVNPVTAISLDYLDTQMLPGVSSHTSLISFREEKVANPHNYFLKVEDIYERMGDSNTIRSLESSIPVEQRCVLLKKYNIQYVLATPDTAERFVSLVSNCGTTVLNVFATRDLILLETR